MRIGLSIKCFFVAVLATAVVVSSGCTVRNYVVEKERPDQEVSGNQGYLTGQPPQKEEREVKMRKSYVVEVELGKPASTSE
jgi:hypothetical protein